MLHPRNLPDTCPCPLCYSDAIVLNVIFKFENKDVVPLICITCIELFTIEEVGQWEYAVSDVDDFSKSLMVDELKVMTLSEIVRKETAKFKRVRWN